jgi:hypothetical protein
MSLRGQRSQRLALLLALMVVPRTSQTPTAAPTAAPTGAPTATPSAAPSQVNFNNFLGSFCSSEGITLDGVDDYLTISPAFTLASDNTIVLRIKLVAAIPSRTTVFDFNTGCGTGYFVQTEASLKLTQQLELCDTVNTKITENDFW